MDAKSTPSAAIKVKYTTHIAYVQVLEIVISLSALHTMEVLRRVALLKVGDFG